MRFILLFLLISLNGFGQGTTSLSDHVIMISIDGFRPDFYREAKWPAPVIKEMAADGVSADGVRGVFPSVTYPSHTTLVTGAMPAIHGIHYNAPFEADGQTGAWYWETSLIQTETLWDAVKKAGKTNASFIWPVSVGGPIDYNVPEVWTLDKGYGRIQPMRDHDSPDGLMEELELEVTGKLNERTFNGDYLNREDRTGEMAAYVLETYKPNFMTLHLIATDHFQHDEGRDGPMVSKALAAADRAIGKIVEAAQRAGILDRTTFIITGDHGFVNIHSRMSPNVWLKDMGLIEDSPDRGKWKAAFHTSGASAFLHLKDPSDSATVRSIRKMLQETPEKYKKLFRVLERSDLAAIGADPAAVLALAPVPGVNMSSATSGEVLSKASGGTHGFYPDFKQIETGFVVWGAGVESGVKISQMGLEDVAPVVSKLLMLDFEAKSGVLYPGIISE